MTAELESQKRKLVVILKGLGPKDELIAGKPADVE
jgi:hypothetical protein